MIRDMLIGAGLAYLLPALLVILAVLVAEWRDCRAARAEEPWSATVCDRQGRATAVVHGQSPDRVLFGVLAELEGQGFALLWAERARANHVNQAEG